MKARGKSSILENRTFHNREFEDKKKLVELRERKAVKISLAFPTLNEEATIGKEVLVLKTELMERYPLIDEIVVIDSGSHDKTRAVAEEFGAKVYRSDRILPRYGSFRGKGENLWKSLFVLTGDIIVWIDADIANIGPKFVYGLVGPLLVNDELGYVKAYYERPIKSDGLLLRSGGGRVTEILIRPLFSLFFPELAGLVQPLSGEYAGRRSILEQLPFSVGYGVEVGHLVDIYHMFGPEPIAQVDLDMRIHRNQSIDALSRMAFGVLSTFVDRLEKYGEARFLTELARTHFGISYDETGSRSPVYTEIASWERPPMISVEQYRRRFAKLPSAQPAPQSVPSG